MEEVEEVEGLGQDKSRGNFSTVGQCTLRSREGLSSLQGGIRQLSVYVAVLYFPFIWYGQSPKKYRLQFIKVDFSPFSFQREM